MNPESQKSTINGVVFWSLFSLFILLSAVLFFVFNYSFYYDLQVNNQNDNPWNYLKIYDMKTWFDSFTHHGILAFLLYIIIPVGFIGIIVSTILFGRLFLKYRKENKKNNFLIIVCALIVWQFLSISFLWHITIDIQDSGNKERIRLAECAMAKNATSYSDCENMESPLCISLCASTVNALTGDLQGCINLSINYAQREVKCSKESINKGIGWCIEGFDCYEYIDQKRQDTKYVGYHNGTYEKIQMNRAS